MIRQLDDRTMVSGQIAPEEVAGLAEHGITVIVNNRPDGEEPGQPLAADIDCRGRCRNPHHFVPIIHGIGPADVERCRRRSRNRRRKRSLSAVKAVPRLCAGPSEDEHREEVEER
jgi:uncharacterized protein (TIGR01244 family)